MDSEIRAQIRRTDALTSGPDNLIATRHVLVSRGHTFEGKNGT